MISLVSSSVLDSILNLSLITGLNLLKDIGKRREIKGLEYSIRLDCSKAMYYFHYFL